MSTPHLTSLRVVREPLPQLRGSPVHVLRSLPRDVSGLTALVGRWAVGEAVIGWDPVATADDPFALTSVPGLPTESGPAPDARGFAGGWLGVWGYQLSDRLESLGPSPRRPVPRPRHRVAFHDQVLRYLDGQWWYEQLRGLGDDDEARRQRFLATLDAAEPSTGDYRLGAFAMVPTPEEHRRNVESVRSHIRAGDVFQVNITARLEASFEGDPVAMFCAGVEQLDPAHAALVVDADDAVVSLSPELFLHRDGREVRTRPIKGTAPLDSDPRVLLASEKDRAENTMIVDLMRNDLGRVSEVGSVEVEQHAALERHAVWHLVSDVRSTLRADLGNDELIAATFPPGSVTGAPKIRAMQIIQELEPTAREAYTGAIGRVGPDGDLELNVAIRTFEIANGRVWLGVGGGVVADSSADAELAECFAKARPLLRAVGGELDRSTQRASDALAGRATLGAVAASRPGHRAETAPPSRPRAGHTGLPGAGAKVLLVDNYDSFVHNLAQAVGMLGASSTVIRNDAETAPDLVARIDRGEFSHVIVSPGPGRPEDAGVSVELIRLIEGTTPVLGVCLGHQAIAVAYGARCVTTRHLAHGRASPVWHDGKGVYRRSVSPVTAGRYHSIVVDEASLPPDLEVTSRTSGGLLMGVRHRNFRVEGIQWHPESILSTDGQVVMAAFLHRDAGVRA